MGAVRVAHMSELLGVRGLARRQFGLSFLSITLAITGRWPFILLSLLWPLAASGNLPKETRLTYDSRGLVSTVREPSTQTSTNLYDALGRLTNHSDSLGGIAFRLDANGNPTNIVEGVKSNSWTFDAYDQALAYKDADSDLIQYKHDQNGNLTNLIYPGNRTLSFAFNGLNLATNITDWLGQQTRIEYDLAGRITKITRPNNTVREIGYDAAGQPTNIYEHTISGAGVVFFKLGWTNTGRLVSEFIAPLPHAWSPPGRTNTVDDDNKLATFNGQSVSSDLDGNMTYGPLTNSSLVVYGFDVRNRLTNSGGISYGYDPIGNRTSITNGTEVTKFVIEPGSGQPLMRIKNSVTNYYIWGPGGLIYEIAESATTTNTRSYHSDLRGSTVAIANSSGAVTDRIEYSAYGLMTYRSGSTDTPFLYNGSYGVMSEPNGLLCMGERYYNPYLSRFINADPSGFSGGLNFFAFANGNPITRLDPSGLGAIEAASGGSWITRTFAGTDVGDWSAGFEHGLESFANGENLDRYTPTGSDAFQSGISSGYNAVPSALEILTIVAAISTSGGSLEAQTALKIEGGAARGTAAKTTDLLPARSPWPANNGFIEGTVERKFLMPGDTVDRYGFGGGKFVSPAGTAMGARALRPGTENLPFNIYQVMKPIEVNAGGSIPWFGQPGLGTQYQLPVSVNVLIKRGFLAPLHP
jgi:RHS repeat-associated protein